MRDGAVRLADLLPCLGLAIVLLLELVWHDVLPGGWRLRSWFEPSAAEQARADDARVAASLSRFARENRALAPGSIVFLGSSTIERSPLADSFPGKPCVNRGVANLSARSLALILPQCLPRAKPSGVVIYTGAVDWRAAGRDTAVLAGSVEAVLDALSRALPGVPAALIGVLPERKMDGRALEALRQANACLADLARMHEIAFVDAARPPMASPSGALSESLSVDDLHLDGEGYRQLAQWILHEGGEVGRLLAP